MNEQAIFKLYAVIVVSIVAQSLLAWELGSKGVQGVIRQPGSWRVWVAFGLFVVQGLWQRIRGLEFPFQSVTDCWPVLIAVGVYFVSRAGRRESP